LTSEEHLDERGGSNFSSLEEYIQPSEKLVLSGYADGIYFAVRVILLMFHFHRYPPLIFHTSLKYRNVCAIFEWIIHIDEVAEVLGSITKLAHWIIL